MHIPDGFINNNITGPALGSAGAFAAVAFHKIYREVMQRVAVAHKQLATIPATSAEITTRQTAVSKSGKRQLWQMATVGSFIFLIQLIDVPLINGTPGHLLGGALAAFILGPWAAMVTMAIVLSIQAIILGDGGTIALGINFLTMGVIAIWTAWGMSSMIKKKTHAILGLSTALSVIITALVTATIMQFDTSRFGGNVQSFILTHCVIGIAEAGVTIVLIRWWQSQKQSIAIADIKK
ncbi:MAG: energy-coupling factor ABC transporter permease [Candidatus Kerfeldbacteria bacterium]|nr:energy-coupling factor ABC transporter permease [Candidatus Kerfeldbacteria bacterium]